MLECIVQGNVQNCTHIPDLTDVCDWWIYFVTKYPSEY